MRVLREQRAKCRHGFIVAAFVGEMEGSFDFLEMADFVARIRQATAAIARRTDIAEGRQLPRLFGIDCLQRINC